MGYIYQRSLLYLIFSIRNPPNNLRMISEKSRNGATYICDEGLVDRQSPVDDVGLRLGADLLSR